MGYFSGFSLPPGTVVNPTMGPGGAASLLQVNGINALSVSNFEQLLYFGVNATDIITGGAGNDIIAGESGDDRLFGGNGDDTLDSGTGIVDMDGGQGFDVASFDLGGLQNGLTIANSANQNLGAGGSLRNFEAYEDIVLGNGVNTVTLSQTQSLTIASGSGSDTFTVLNAAAEIYVGFGDDNITTGGGNDYIEGSVIPPESKGLHK